MILKLNKQEKNYSYSHQCNKRDLHYGIQSVLVLIILTYKNWLK